MALRHPELARTIAENIRENARRKGGALDTLADLAGISRSYLYAIVGAQNAVTVDKLASIAEALGLRVRDLLEPRGVGERERGPSGRSRR